MVMMMNVMMMYNDDDDDDDDEMMLTAGGFTDPDPEKGLGPQGDGGDNDLPIEDLIAELFKTLKTDEGR
jgi:hypothetical protein